MEEWFLNGSELDPSDLWGLGPCAGKIIVYI